MQTTSLDTDLHVDDNDASPTEAAPTPGVLLSYPEWPAVIDSLLDAFARLDAVGRPTQGASATIAPTDGSPPATATMTDKEALVCAADCERPGVSRMDHSLNGFLEAAMTLHIRAVLRHNRQVRLDALTQSSEGGQTV